MRALAQAFLTSSILSLTMVKWLIATQPIDRQTSSAAALSAAQNALTESCSCVAAEFL